MHFNLLIHRLSRHAIRYKGDLRTSSTSDLDRPMSASSRSSSWRSSLYSCRRSHASAIPVSHTSGLCHDHLRSGNETEAASRLLVELPIMLPQDMFHLRNGAKQRLAAGAHRAVVNGPSDFCITPTFGAQARVSGEAIWSLTIRIPEHATTRCRFGGLSIVFKQGLAPFAPLAGDWHPNR